MSLFSVIVVNARDDCKIYVNDGFQCVTVASYMGANIYIVNTTAKVIASGIMRNMLRHPVTKHKA